MKHGNTQKKAVRKRLSMVMLCLCIAFFLAGCRSGDPITTLPVTTHPPSKSQIQPLLCQYTDPLLLKKQTDECTPYDLTGELAAAVVPHHAPHLDLLCSLLSSDVVQNAGYETVLVIGPNHTGDGSPIQVTGNGYYWESGAVGGDKYTADLIADDFRLRVDTDTQLLSDDHTASVLMPYIAHYLPDADVTALLVSTGVSRNELDSLAEDITALSQEKKLLILFSVDFSHYQTPNHAANYDKETRQTVLSGASEKLFQYGNEHLDSPQSVFLFMTLAESLGAVVSETDYRHVPFTENGELQAMSYFVFTAMK